MLFNVEGYKKDEPEIETQAFFINEEQLKEWQKENVLVKLAEL